MEKYSFTLAEVLITLVVIGIIAAITVPVIMANHKKTETSARLKKFYANMSNAVKLAETEWGTDTTGFKYGNCNYSGNKQFFENYLSKYLNYVRTDELKSGNTYYDSLSDGLYSGFEGLNPQLFVVYLGDGSLFFNDECPESLVYDVNGEKGPNRYGRDIFYFFFLAVNENPKLTIPHFNTDNFMFLVNSDGSIYPSYTREEKKENCKNKTQISSCTSLIEMDGWEFKEDYPYKL